MYSLYKKNLFGSKTKKRFKSIDNKNTNNDNIQNRINNFGENKKDKINKNQIEITKSKFLDNQKQRYKTKNLYKEISNMKNLKTNDNKKDSNLSEKSSEVTPDIK